MQKMKLTKRIFACALSLIMAFSCFSVVPFIATAEVNDNLTVIEPTLAEGKTNTESGYTWAQKAEKLYAGASYAGTTLQVDNIYDSTLKALGDNNIIESVVAKDSSGTTKTFNLTSVTDGDIYDRTNSDTADYGTGFTFPARTAEPLGRNRFGTDTYDAEITVTLSDVKIIDAVYAFAHPGTHLAWNTYKIYVGNDAETLFSDANEVAYFDYYDAYKNQSTVAWSLNGTHGGSGTDRRSEGQIWKFTDEKPVGKYVGYKVYLAELGIQNRLDLYDIGVFGDTAYTIDAGSNSTDNVNAITAKSSYMPFNLKVADISPTYLHDTYAAKNAISKIEFIRNGEAAYNDSSTVANISGVYAFDRMTDGKIYDASGTDPYNSSLGWYGNSTVQLGNYYYTGSKTHLDRVAETGENYDAKFIMTLDSETIIDTFYFIGHIRAYLTTTTYKVFAGNDKDTLFSADNEIALFDYTKYTANSIAKLNGSNYSEGQIWTFNGDEKPQGKYVGLIVYDAASNTDYPGFLEVAELGVTGESLNKATADTDAAIITSNYTASVKVTDITPDFLTADRVANNVLKKGTITAANNAGEELIGSGSIAAITDGVMDTAGTYTANSFWYIYNTLTLDGVPQGYVTFSLDSLYELDELYLIGSPRANYALLDYEIYAGADQATLYNSENLVASFQYSGYTSSSTTTGKLNTANSNQNSEGQIYTFNGEDKPLAQYVGIKIFDGAMANFGWVYFSEVGILGTNTQVELEVEGLNDETSIVPVGDSMTGVEGEPFSFKVNVKNGGTATKVAVNGTELTAVDGVYTIDSFQENMKITVETDRDEFATTNDIWNGLDLSLSSAAYGANIWDEEVMVHETAMFYGDRTEVQLLYPIENIISIRSYDLQTAYWVGEDFEIVDGKLKLTENSRMTAYENADDLKNLTETGDTNWSSIGAWESKQWKYQVRVTYTHSTTWDGTTYNVAPEGQMGELGKFHKKALSGEDTTVLFLGDSISVGCNASGLYQETLQYNSGADASTLSTKIQSYYAKYGLSAVPDWASESWATQVTEALKVKYNNDNITMVNKAVGSSASTWGAKTQNLDFFLDGVNPDLVFIGYGMNESGSESLNDNLRTIINYIRNINPDCSVVLVSAFYPNFSHGTDNNLDTQEAAYYELLDEYDNLAIAPVNSVFHAMQTVKTPADYTANAYNHPNDFGVRVYASTIMATLSGDVNPVTVTFTDNADNVVHTVSDYGSVTITEADLEAAQSKLPTIFGYDFTAWNDEITTADSDKVLKAIYVKTAEQKYSVKATDGEEVYEGWHQFDARLTANATGDGFSYWKDSDNSSPLSAKKAYTFYVPGDINIESVYNDTENAVKPVVLNSAVQKALRADGNYNLYFTGDIELPDGAELTAVGVTYTNSAEKVNALETTTPDIANGIATKAYTENLKGGSIMVILNSVKPSKQRWAKLYVTYTLNSQSYTVYSDCTAAGSTAE